MGYKIYKYTAQKCTVIVKALEIYGAYELLADKCEQEELDQPDIKDLILIDSEDSCSNVIAFIDNR